eukprot:COSAG02_NODE_25824_length_648_cov_0.626594_1_plen_99_part_00
MRPLQHPTGTAAARGALVFRLSWSRAISWLRLAHASQLADYPASLRGSPVNASGRTSSSLLEVWITRGARARRGHARARWTCTRASAAPAYRLNHLYY